MPAPATPVRPVELDPEHDDVHARQRAAPLPPGERRAAIVSATIPLLIAHGSRVTTKQIAEAAGIAEGTIFRVFPDKESLIEAAVERAFDPEPVDLALRAIDRSLGFEQQLGAAAEIVQRRVEAIWQLMAAVGMSKPPEGVRPSGEPPKPPNSAALAELFEPKRDELRRDPAACAQLFRGLIFAASHPALADEPMPPSEIVSILLDGIRVPGAPAGGDEPC
jgi:AcrR family transcriptional regulator